MDSISEIVTGRKTKHKRGFLEEEIAELLKSFPAITSQKFNEALGTITCVLIKGKAIISHNDVEKALRCCIENRPSKFEEWD